MFKPDLFREIKYAFRVELASDFSPWDCTVDELVNRIEQMIDREFVEIPSDRELRCRAFDEITACLANALGRDKKDFQLDQRFRDFVPWYRRGRARKTLTQTLDKHYAWLFRAEPGCGVVALLFFLAGLSGAVFLTVFEEQPRLFPLVLLVTLACYIFSCLIMDRLFLQPFSRLPFKTISDAVDSIVGQIKWKDEYVWATYHGNREAIRDQLLQILSSTVKLDRRNSKGSKLKEDFLLNGPNTRNAAHR